MIFIDAVLRIYRYILLALLFSYYMNSSIGTCVKKLKLTIMVLLLLVDGEVDPLNQPMWVMAGDGESVSAIVGEAFTPLLRRVSPMFARLPFCDIVGLFFTSVRKLLPIARSSFVGIEARARVASACLPGDIKFVYEGYCKPGRLPGTRDI